MNKKLMMIVLHSLLLSACAWVKVSSEGEGVSVLTTAQVEARNCERLGKANAQTMDRITFIERSNRAQREELEKLAKNEAANMGGNAVVADSEIVDGRQAYIIYNCQ